MQNALTTTKPNGELALSAPVPGLSVFEQKAVAAWETPKLTDAIASDEDGTKNRLKVLIARKLEDAARKSGVSKMLEGQELTLIVSDIIEVLQEFPRLRLGEIPLIFDLGAVGKLGEEFVGHSINARTFRAWVLTFDEEKRNELLTRQVEEQRKRDEENEARRREISPELVDLIGARLFVRSIEQIVSSARNEAGAKIQISGASVPGDIDLGAIWFNKFKAVGILEELAPLTVAQKKEIFEDQIKTVKQLNRQFGSSWSEETIQRRAKSFSEAVWFRMVVAGLVNRFETVEAIESFLISRNVIPQNWMARIETLGKAA